jgi:hypothetical protein
MSAVLYRLGYRSPPQFNFIAMPKVQCFTTAAIEDCLQ